MKTSSLSNNHSDSCSKRRLSFFLKIGTASVSAGAYSFKVVGPKDGDWKGTNYLDTKNSSEGYAEFDLSFAPLEAKLIMRYQK